MPNNSSCARRQRCYIRLHASKLSMQEPQLKANSSRHKSSRRFLCALNLLLPPPCVSSNNFAKSAAREPACLPEILNHVSWQAPQPAFNVAPVFLRNPTPASSRQLFYMTRCKFFDDQGARDSLPLSIPRREQLARLNIYHAVREAQALLFDRPIALLLACLHELDYIGFVSFASDRDFSKFSSSDRIDDTHGDTALLPTQLLTASSHLPVRGESASEERNWESKKGRPLLHAHLLGMVALFVGNNGNRVKKALFLLPQSCKENELKRVLQVRGGTTESLEVNNREAMQMESESARGAAACCCPSTPRACRSPPNRISLPRLPTFPNSFRVEKAQLPHLHSLFVMVSRLPRNCKRIGGILAPTGNPVFHSEISLERSTRTEVGTTPSLLLLLLLLLTAVTSKLAQHQCFYVSISSG